MVIVGSHLTGLMDTIMRNTWAGQLEHLVYLLVGLQFFVLILGDEPIRWQLAAPARWLLLAVGDGRGHLHRHRADAADRTRSACSCSSNVHVDPLSDTHTGGAIMWFGGDGVMAAVMVVLVVGWLRRVDTAPGRREGLAGEGPAGHVHGAHRRP